MEGESAVVAGSGVAFEDEVDVAIGFGGTVACN